MKTLFLLKKNLIYGSYNSVIAKSGLLNSAQITSRQLEKHLGIKTDIEICVDGNEVDKFVHRHRPRCVIIEALWVTPEKMKELATLYPKVIFVVLIHSETTFLAQEGNAIQWIKEYNEIDTVYPCFNSKATYEQFRALGIVTWYLPNVYHDVHKKHTPVYHHHLHIASFGAIRPFKNQLIQAMAAMIFASQRKKVLHFHMNTTRTEQMGESVLKNIIALFEGTQHRLIGHGWMERHKFLEVVSRMDFGMQISFSESFNIVASDFVHEGVPIVVSPTIDWMPDAAKASTEDMGDILKRMEYVYNNPGRISERSTRYLNTYNRGAIKEWAKFINLILL